MRLRSAALTLVLAMPGLCQPPVDPEPYVIETDVNLVLVEAAVTTKAGGPVGGLTRQDFVIYDNGVRREITRFGSSEQPVSVALVVDFSGSMRPRIASVLSAVRAFIQVLRPDDEASLTLFHDIPEVSSSLEPVSSLHVNTFLAPLAQVPGGRTSLYDAILTGLGQLKKARHGRRALVLISDGGDNQSVAAWSNVERALEESQTIVYGVGVFAAHDKEADPGVLHRLARQTGGLSILDPNARELVTTCHKIAEDLRSRYQLGFVVSESDAAGLRRLKVEASRNGRRLQVRARKSYRLPKPHDEVE